MIALSRNQRLVIVMLGIVGAFVAGLALLCGGMLLAIWDPPQNWSRQEIQASQRIGDEIVVALEQYQAKHGEYPESLGDLIPEFMNVVSPPVAGTKEWHYQAFESRDGDLTYDLVLHANESEYPVCYYTQGWGWLVSQ